VARGAGGKPVMASNGLAIIPDIGTNSDRDVDMLFVCAGGNPATFNDKAVFAWLRKLARRGVTIGGISGGPYILAHAGLLDGRRVTLHWEHQPAFSEDFLTSPWRPLCSRLMATGSPAPEASRPST
jgi:transcriptional regulator GlxA family with amidase domain